MTAAANSSAEFTASQIAKALTASDRVMRRRLASVRPSRVTVDQGGECRRWAFDALPFDLQQRLEVARQAGGFASIAQMMGIAPAEAPQLPALADCHPEDVDAAVKLRAALERVLVNRNRPLTTGADLVAMGLADYKTAFGHVVSERHWRRLFQRTLNRAGTTADFTRLEIYLPDRPRMKPGATPAAEIEDEDDELAAIRCEIQGFDDPLNLSRGERELVWTRAVELYRERTAGGEPARAVKETLFDFLLNTAPSLARSRDSLRVLFNKRLVDPDAVRDRRIESNEKRAKAVDSDDIARLVYTAIRKYRGRLAPALREVRGGKLGTRKSYVPETISREAAPMIAALMPFQQGPRAADKASPSMDLSYDGIRPMDCLVIDDATWNVYVKWPLPGGGWKLTRGQIILIIDFLTLRVLHFGIIPEEQPNSLLAYTVTTKAIAKYGVPKAIYLERGKVFAESKLMTGGKRTMQTMRSPGWRDVPSAERTLGLQRLGIQIITARRARSKVVELVIGLLQNLTDGELGYCGRNERFDRPEALTWLLKEAASSDPARSAKALAQFYAFEEWADRFEQHVDTYNATAQEGKHLRGLSPDAAFDQWWPRDNPPTKLCADSARWFMPHRQEKMVCGGAVSFTLCGELFSYRHESLSRWEDHSVMVWFNPELPEAAVVTDLKHRNPLVIPRDNQPNALTVLTNPDDPVLAAETAKIQRHQRYWAGIHRSMKVKFELSFRSVIVPPRIKEVSRAVEQAEQQVHQRRRGEDTADRTRRQIALKIGRQPEELPPAAADYNRELLEGLRELKRETEGG